MSLKVRTAEATRQMSEDGGRLVLATSRMIELMEVAASRLMQQLAGDGQTSVGIGTNVTHRASGPTRGVVRAVATCTGFSGRVHRFTVNVFDESGLVGSGEHTRAVVVASDLKRPRRRAHTRREPRSSAPPWPGPT